MKKRITTMTAIIAAMAITIAVPTASYAAKNFVQNHQSRLDGTAIEEEGFPNGEPEWEEVYFI
ncbi:MAG: hypothetical protein Q4B03_10005 [Lachnospiraceae bacterium]|nr:hypothetical protein [Lachnospiraceae bacterium]